MCRGVVLTLACSLVFGGAAHAYPIFPGNSFDPSTNTGLFAESGQLGPPHINNFGVAVGNGGSKLNNIDQGWVTVRWSPTSTESLAALGLNPEGKPFPHGSDIDDAGIVAGTSYRYGAGGSSLGIRPVLWNSGSTTPIELPLSNDLTVNQSGNVAGIDSAGNVFGYASGAANFPMRWPIGSNSFQHMATLGSPTSGFGTGLVNYVAANGMSAGTAALYNASGAAIGSRPVRWNADGTVATEFPQVGGSSPKLSGINDRGSVIGNLNGPGVYYAPDSTTPTFLKGFAISDAGTTNASVIGNCDVIAGSVPKYVNGVYQYIAPVIWPTPTSTPVELNVGMVLNNRTSIHAVNSTGHAIGETTNFSVTPNVVTPWLSSIDGSSVTIQSLVTDPGWTINSVLDLSDTGWIVGEATFDPDGAGPIASYRRFYSMLVPQAGTYGNGDANFDGHCNFSDLLKLAQYFNQPSNGRTDVADFNLNGITDFNDLLTLSQHYEAGVSAAAAERALAQPLVPEPAILLGIGMATCHFLYRRPRSCQRRIDASV